MLLELKNVVKRYDSPGGGPPLTALDGVSLTVEKGQSIAIVGPSGSGKTTLLNIMGALDRPSSGRASFDGQDLSALSDDELAAARNLKIGFVFQSHHLLPQCTALENALVPTIPARRAASGAEDARARAERLLERVGLGPRLHHRPGQLSGGECQRVAVARALINKPRLVLADEPTGSLDSVSAGALGRLLLELNEEEETALVVVTHSNDFARLMKSRFALRDGRLDADSLR